MFKQQQCNETNNKNSARDYVEINDNSTQPPSYQNNQIESNYRQLQTNQQIIKNKINSLKHRLSTHAHVVPRSNANTNPLSPVTSKTISFPRSNPSQYEFQSSATNSRSNNALVEEVFDIFDHRNQLPTRKSPIYTVNDDDNDYNNQKNVCYDVNGNYEREKVCHQNVRNKKLSLHRQHQPNKQYQRNHDYNKQFNNFEISKEVNELSLYKAGDKSTNRDSKSNQRDYRPNQRLPTRKSPIYTANDDYEPTNYDICNDASESFQRNKVHGHDQRKPNRRNDEYHNQYGNYDMYERTNDDYKPTINDNQNNVRNHFKAHRYRHDQRKPNRRNDEYYNQYGNYDMYERGHQNMRENHNYKNRTEMRKKNIFYADKANPNDCYSKNENNNVKRERKRPQRQFAVVFDPVVGCITNNRMSLDFGEPRVKKQKRERHNTILLNRSVKPKKNKKKTTTTKNQVNAFSDEEDFDLNDAPSEPMHDTINNSNNGARFERNLNRNQINLISDHDTPASAAQRQDFSLLNLNRIIRLQIIKESPSSDNASD